MPVTADTLDAIQKGGMLLLLLIAIYWMNKERIRLVAENKLKDDRLVQLSERAITAMVELKGTVQGVADIFKNGSRRS